MNTYIVWCPDYGQSEEDGRTVHADCAQYAAQQWAHWQDYHSADYLIVSGQYTAVRVRLSDPASDDERKILRYLVWGESVPQYTARLIVDAETKP